MTLSALQLSIINHVVSNELAPDKHLSDASFAKICGCSTDTIQRHMKVMVNCTACDWKLETSKEIPKSCKKCGEKVEYRPLYPEFYQALQGALKEARETNDFYGLRLHQWGLEELQGLYEKASTPTEKQKILTQILAQTKDAVPTTGAVDYAHYPDDQLIEIAMNRMDNSLDAAMKQRLIELSRGA